MRGLLKTGWYGVGVNTSMFCYFSLHSSCTLWQCLFRPPPWHPIYCVPVVGQVAGLDPCGEHSGLIEQTFRASLHHCPLRAMLPTFCPKEMEV